MIFLFEILVEKAWKKTKNEEKTWKTLKSVKTAKKRLSRQNRSDFSSRTIQYRILSTSSEWGLQIVNFRTAKTVKTLNGLPTMFSDEVVYGYTDVCKHVIYMFTCTHLTFDPKSTKSSILTVFTSFLEF